MSTSGKKKGSEPRGFDLAMLNAQRIKQPYDYPQDKDYPITHPLLKMVTDLMPIPPVEELQKQRFIGIAGTKRSGKDTAAKYLIEKHGFVQINFADKLRLYMSILNPVVDVFSGARYNDVVAEIGYERAKDEYPEFRRLMVVFATDVMRKQYDEDFWVYRWQWDVWAATEVAKKPLHVVTSDVRFPNELEEIRHFGGEVWWIARKNVEKGSHESENSIGPSDCDLVIHNDGTIEELHAQIEANLQGYMDKMAR